MKSITYLNTATEQSGKSRTWCTYCLDGQSSTVTLRYNPQYLVLFAAKYHEDASTGAEATSLSPEKLPIELETADGKETLPSHCIYSLVHHMLENSPAIDNQAVELALLHFVARTINPGLHQLIDCIQRLEDTPVPLYDEDYIKASLENIGWPDSKETRARLGSYKAVKEIMQEVKK